MNRFRDARTDAAMTQQHLAMAAEVSLSTVRRMEAGEQVSPESRRAVASVLGIPVSDQVQGDRLPPVIRIQRFQLYFIPRRFKDSVRAARGIWIVLTMASLIGFAVFQNPAWFSLAMCHAFAMLPIAISWSICRERSWRDHISTSLLAMFAMTFPGMAFLPGAGTIGTAGYCLMFSDLLLGIAMFRVSFFGSLGINETTTRLGGSEQLRSLRRAREVGAIVLT